MKAERRSDLTLPHVFHFVWVGQKNIPDKFLEYRESWKRHHPDWVIKVWDNDEAIAKNTLYCTEFLKHCSSASQMKDVIAAEVLWRFGGIYVDSDFECLKPIDGLLEEELKWGYGGFSASESEGIVSVGIMGCYRNFLPMIALYGEIIQTLVGESTSTLVTGPQAATKVLGKFTKLHVPMQMRVKIFGPELFYPYSYNEKHRANEEFPNAYAVHHWAATWQDEDKK